MKQFMMIPRGFAGLPVDEGFITPAENKKNYAIAVRKISTPLKCHIMILYMWTIMLMYRRRRLVVVFKLVIHPRQGPT
jgi:hypothetical protein